MRKLVVSCKTADQVFEDFKHAAKKARRGVFKGQAEYEVSFDNKTDFDKFVRNMKIGVVTIKATKGAGRSLK